MAATRTRKATDTFTAVTAAEALAFFASPFLSGASSAAVISNLAALRADQDAWAVSCADVCRQIGDAGWALYAPDAFYLWRLNDPIAGVRFDPADPALAVWLRSPGVIISSVTDWPVTGPVFKAIR